MGVEMVKTVLRLHELAAIHAGAKRDAIPAGRRPPNEPLEMARLRERIKALARLQNRND
jgi:hypothetical protein